MADARSMEYRQIVPGEPLSRLGMGCMRLPTRFGRVDYGAAQEIIDYAMAHGVNYYDTAYIYHAGQSEKFLGKALQKYPRDSYHIATKYFGTGFPNYRKVFANQLERLQTDYVDYYLIHSVMNATANGYEKRGAIEYFLEQKALGRIRHLGFSSHAGLDTLRGFIGKAPWDFVQLQINYYDWAFGTARQQYDIATGAGLPIVVMEPVRGGKLAKLPANMAKPLERMHPDWTPASWALRWVKGLDNVAVVLSGMSTLDQMRDNAATFCAPALTQAESDTLMHACGALADTMAVPCTACRYCCDSCPKHIDIPALMEAYNRYKAPGGAFDAAEIAHYPAGRGPADCIQCGACTKHCPQEIDVPAVLSELAHVAAS
ncbi:MAG: aldo/keto reductase [Eggerthellaceae bacterium]|jgi:predicted aldo/keto reductase-like oxidoreductase